MAKSRYEYVKQFQVSPILMPQTWIVARIDGRSFSKFTKDHHFQKPNDPAALQLMNLTAKKVCQKFTDILFAYGQSDQYSFIFRKKAKLFNRRTDKIISTIGSYFTSCYIFYWRQIIQTPLQYPVSFDCRVVVYPTDQILIDYCRWRQADCHVNNLYNTVFWALVQSGMTQNQAHQRLKGSTSSQKHQMLFELGINYNDEPDIYKKGTVLIKPQYSPVHLDIFHVEFYKENGIFEQQMGNYCNCLNSNTQNTERDSQALPRSARRIEKQIIDSKESPDQLQNTKNYFLTLHAVSRAYLDRKKFQAKKKKATQNTEIHFQNKEKRIEQLKAEIKKVFGKFRPEKKQDQEKLVEKPSKNLQDGWIYTGLWNEKKEPHGFGQLILPEIYQYRGQFLNGDKHGLGQAFQQDGSVYYGYFQANVKHGLGGLKQTDGNTYIGQFRSDKKYGQGLQYHSDGSKYEGNFKRGRKEGEGRIEWTNGAFYQGNFYRDKINGQGVYEMPGKQKYTGEWENGIREGKGILEFADGRIYQGEFANGLMEGQGTLQYPNGKVYRGNWRKGKEHGEGEITYKGKNGKMKSKKGIWKNSELVNWSE